MEDNVFCSKIKRRQEKSTNNLYDLINVQPATPIKRNEQHVELVCNFHPECGKLYIPKKRSNKTTKVKTVRDIRNEYEQDIFFDLPSDLEKQQTLLYKKITEGSSNDINTKTLAIKLIKSGNPINRETWQMLTNINAYGYTHGIQYVLWNGKRIRVTGSKGGKTKFLHNCDLAVEKLPHKHAVASNNKIFFKKKCLLRNSLAIKFKPGPLSRKISLDNSFQKYNVGSTELVKLPKIGLSVSPKPGVILPPEVASILQSFRNLDGTISEKWAEFAVSMLQTGNNSNASLTTLEEDSVTFNLNYKSDQNVLLMRQVDISKNYITSDTKILSFDKEKHNSSISSEVSSVLNCILDTVDISLKQDNFYSGIDDPREVAPEDIMNAKRSNIGKEGNKRNLELDRLDVTVIRLPQNADDDIEPCRKSFCSQGCICSSLQSNYHIKNHCGKMECMFGCKCDYSKLSDSFENDCPEILQGLIISMDSVRNSRLAKEEKKFHQTVVLTGEKSIVLKSQKRSCKATKRYAEYFESKPLKPGTKKHLILSLNKVNCTNIEPWCMVHNLYKCFCKGQFTGEQSQTNVQEDRLWLSKEVEEDNSMNSDNIEDSVSDTDKLFSISMKYPKVCARTKPFTGRKYKPSFYSEINNKIRNLEANDTKMQKRILTITSNNENSKKIRCNSDDEIITLCDDMNTTPTNDNIGGHTNVMNDSRLEHNENIEEKDGSEILQEYLTDSIISANSSAKPKPILGKANDIPNSSCPPSKSILSSWLETSYRNYKQRLDRGIKKIVLDPPKQGKLALYPWEFILSRYKERKNLFLISKQKPYRIFMAVDLKNDFFQNCMNIDDIRLADLRKYPVTVKNLLTNATDLRDNFCILFGLHICWELVGSVTKVNPKPGFDSESPPLTQHGDENPETDENISLQLCETNKEETESAVEAPVECSTSKWFIMTVEKDFSEIQFYNRGFFVKYDSIMKSINVARATGNTIRLSQKSVEHQSSPQFGIYAVPNANEHCVFVGPYEKDECLGIEVVKSISQVRKQNRTRGFWITTSTVDNYKVIDNPLAFMPQNHYHVPEVVHIEDSNEHEFKKDEEDKNKTENSTQNLNVTSIAKPIKQTKYVFIKALPKQTKFDINSKLTSLLKPQTVKQLTIPSQGSSISLSQSTDNKKPVAEIAPQIKNIISLAETVKKDATATRIEKSMFVLKPEEINQRIMKASSSSQSSSFVEMTQKCDEGIKKPTPSTLPMQSSLDVEMNQNSEEGVEMSTPPCLLAQPALDVENKQKSEEAIKKIPPSSSSEQSQLDAEMTQDIENFLATAKVCTLPDADNIYEISDDEDSDKSQYKQVWIECVNIENIGWINGLKNKFNMISFAFPGFKYTNFYVHEVAFTKINMVLSRKIYIPKSLKAIWRVVESKKDLSVNLNMLNLNNFGKDFVLTKRGPKHRSELGLPAHILKFIKSHGT